MNKISSINNLKYTVIDCRLLNDKYGKMFIYEYIKNPYTDNHSFLLLDFPNTFEKTSKLKKLLFHKTGKVTKKFIENKKAAKDVKIILDYFSKKEGIDLDKVSLPDKIDFGKKIVYLSKYSQSFIKEFPKSEECPGFLEGVFGFGCPHNCVWCFLRVTARMRPFVTIYLNLEDFEKDLQKLQKKNNKRRINTGEKNDILAISPLIPSYIRKMIELASLYDQKLLFMTKSCNVDTIPIKQDNYDAIFGFSIDNPIGIEKCQLNTSSYEQRLLAGKEIIKKGYDIVWRYDPIHIDEAFESFFNKGKNISVMNIDLDPILKVIDEIDFCKKALILGTYRGYTQLDHFMQIKLQKNWKDIFELDEIHYKNKKKPAIRVKYPKIIRHYILNAVYNYAKEKGFKNIRICKDPNINLGKGACICNLP